MAFTSGFTAVTGATFTAAQYNTNVRDNFTAIWVYTTAGDISYATGSTTLSRLGIGTAYQFLQVNSAANAPQWGGLQFASVYHDTTQNINNNASTPLSFNSENSDLQGWHSTSTNTTRVTVTENGFYICSWNYLYAGAAGSGTYRDDIEVALDATTFHFERVFNIDADANTKYYGGTSIIKSATAGQYFEIYHTQRSGGTRTVGANATFTVWKIAQ